jgi:hypothetical protein
MFESSARAVPVRIDAVRRLIVMLQAVAIALPQSSPFQRCAGRTAISASDEPRNRFHGLLRNRFHAHSPSRKLFHFDARDRKWAGEISLWLEAFAAAIC